MHTDEDGKKQLSKFKINVDRFSKVDKDVFEKAFEMEKRFKSTGGANVYY